MGRREAERADTDRVLRRAEVEGLLLPGVPPNRAYLIIKQRGPNRYHWHLYKRPANGGTIPGKKPVFRHVSILFRPHAVRRIPQDTGETGNLVEAPGTAPGPLCLLHKPFIAIAGKPALLI